MLLVGCRSKSVAETRSDMVLVDLQRRSMGWLLLHRRMIDLDQDDCTSVPSLHDCRRRRAAGFSSPLPPPLVRSVSSSSPYQSGSPLIVVAEDEQKGFRCYHPPSKKVYISRHVVFNEHTFPYDDPRSLFSSSQDNSTVTTYEEFDQWQHPEKNNSLTQVLEGEQISTMAKFSASTESQNDTCPCSVDLPLSSALDATISHHAHQSSYQNTDHTTTHRCQIPNVAGTTYPSSRLGSAPSHNFTQLDTIVSHDAEHDTSHVPHGSHESNELGAATLQHPSLGATIQVDLHCIYHKNFPFPIAAKSHSRPPLQMLPHPLLKWVTQWSQGSVGGEESSSSALADDVTARHSPPDLSVTLGGSTIKDSLLQVHGVEENPSSTFHSKGGGVGFAIVGDIVFHRRGRRKDSTPKGGFTWSGTRGGLLPSGVHMSTSNLKYGVVQDKGKGTSLESTHCTIHPEGLHGNRIEDLDIQMLGQMERINASLALEADSWPDDMAKYFAKCAISLSQQFV
ncbi:hypothetical protein MRB53_004715 [Persea americana]|uniref:Uncharacterized protein n=1 Tax=Persea americana TaxID=3435 RepID=A0ACC2MBB7_PERAE|nr:hypothetical protein MRB53_004715 [Persea americana]